MPDRNALDSLNDAERAALRLVARGLQSKEVAAELDRPLNTVERHIKSARAKLGGVPRIVAARRLVSSEGDQPMVDHPLTLPGRDGDPPSPPHQSDPDRSLCEERATFVHRPPPDRSPEREDRAHDLSTWSRLALVALAMAAIMNVIVAWPQVLGMFRAAGAVIVRSIR